MKKRLILTVISIGVLLSSCTKPETLHSWSACNIDFNQPIETERLSFKLSEVWGELKPCDAVHVYHDLTVDDWSIVARGAELYKSVVALTTAISMGVNSNMWFLGMNREKTPEQWYKKKSKNGGITYTNGNPTERQFRWVTKRGMGCWRVDSKTYLIKSKNKKQIKQLYAGGVSYTCWPESKRIYPEIWIGASVAYRNDKPVYPDIDLEKDILDPVFASLKIKELTEEQYNQRVQKNKEAKRKRCEESYQSYLKELNTSPGAVNDAFMNNMLDCGYSDAKQRRCESLEKHKDRIRRYYIDNMFSRNYTGLEQVKETMRSCGYTEQAVIRYEKALCDNSLEWLNKKLKNKKYRPYKKIIRHLKQCGYKDNPVYIEGKKREIACDNPLC